MIACALVMRLRDDPDVQSAMLDHFGFVLTRCDLSELKRIGGKPALVAFWRSLLIPHSAFRIPHLEQLALELLKIHSTISPPPGILTDAWSFAQALRAEARAILSGAGSVSRSTAHHRLSLCRACPHLQRTAAGSRCDLCHCYVRLKTKFRAESCPAGKW